MSSHVVTHSILGFQFFTSLAGPQTRYKQSKQLLICHSNQKCYHILLHIQSWASSSPFLLQHLKHHQLSLFLSLPLLFSSTQLILKEWRFHEFSHDLLSKMYKYSFYYWNSTKNANFLNNETSFVQHHDENNPNL